MPLKKLYLSILFVLSLNFCCFGQDKKPDSGAPVKFEVSSIRVLSEEELVRKTGDNIIESGYALKCRISNSGRQTVYLYNDFANSLSPRGFLVRKTDKGLVWVLDASGKTSPKSPGLKPPYRLSSGTWLMLGEGDAIEWETIQETPSSEETRAMTAFLKLGSSQKEIEIFSNFYNVPTKQAK